MSRIMIVEDSQDIRFIVHEILRRKGYTTIEAENGVQALEILEQDSQVDLIISDIRMAKMTGLELLGELKQRYPHIPAIILTVHTIPEWIDEAMRKGAVSYLTKPFTPSELIDTVERNLIHAAT